MKNSAHLSAQLTHFKSLVSFYIPWKHQKTFGFLMFSGGLERDQWHEMDYFFFNFEHFSVGYFEEANQILK